ncbi:PD-(D/E)XK nuclease family protein [bacterium]|nr:PD-(D/E)XK nuclease family protein [bacterium]
MIKKSYDRILEISKDHKQITLPDSRYYRRNGEYYPSVTYVLQAYPKGKFFEDWLKKVGYSAEYIVKKAAEEGTATHELIEEYFEGKEMNFLNEKGNPTMHPDIWKMFLRFVDFWETYKPTLIETETHLFSDELKVAGTVDLICEIDGELWVIDFKTSNHLQTTYDLQGAVYAKCYEECFGKKVDRVGVLWLKSKSRGEDKTGKRLKGKNWEIYESPRTQDENIEIFHSVKKLFDLENPKHKPATTSFKTTVKRTV